MLSGSDAESRVVILFTDGEENVATEQTPDEIAPLHAAQLCEELGVRVYTIVAGIGSPDQSGGWTALDTSQVEPTSHVIPLATPMREDRPGASYPPETAVANAPARDGSAFAVPKVLEGEDEG